jgi:hypothetical protein
MTAVYIGKIVVVYRVRFDKLLTFGLHWVLLFSINQLLTFCILYVRR